MHYFFGKNADWLLSGIATVWSKNGFSLWLLAEGIKPLIDSGLHYKIEHDGLTASFPELTYRNTAFQQYNGVTQPILFGRSAQSIHPSARALPEYLLDGVSYLVPPTRNEALYTPDVRRFSVQSYRGELRQSRFGRRLIRSNNHGQVKKSKIGRSYSSTLLATDPSCSLSVIFL